MADHYVMACNHKCPMSSIVCMAKEIDAYLGKKSTEKLGMEDVVFKTRSIMVAKSEKEGIDEVEKQKWKNSLEVFGKFDGARKYGDIHKFRNILAHESGANILNIHELKRVKTAARALVQWAVRGASDGHISEQGTNQRIQNILNIFAQSLR